MNKPILKEMIKDEIRMNSTFEKGRNRAKILALIYIANRFSDPILSPILAKMPFEFSFQLLFNLIVALWVGSAAIRGSVKLSGALCLLTPAGNTATMLIAANSYAGGFREMMNTAPVAWYVIVVSIICAITGIWLLVDKNVAAFGRRRRELQKEYVDLLKAWGTAPASDESDLPQEDVIVSDVLPKESESVIEACYKEEIQLRQEEHAELQRLNEVSQQENIAKLMHEFKGEDSTLRAFSKVNMISKIPNKRFFDVQRELLCRKFGCSETEIDPATYVIAFPIEGKVLMRWLKEEKRLYMESDTKRYSMQFHKSALDAIAYVGKLIGSKLITTDISGYADSNDEEILRRFFNGGI